MSLFLNWIKILVSQFFSLKSIATLYWQSAKAEAYGGRLSVFWECAGFKDHIAGDPLVKAKFLCRYARLSIPFTWQDSPVSLQPKATFSTSQFPLSSTYRKKLLCIQEPGSKFVLSECFCIYWFIVTHAMVHSQERYFYLVIWSIQHQPLLQAPW